MQKITISFNIACMNYSFINQNLDKKTFLNTAFSGLNSVLAENNISQFVKMKDFFISDKFMLLVNGFVGSGKSSVVNHFVKFLNSDVVVISYNCYETTILDDILLHFFEQFKQLQADGQIQEPKARSENFLQKINSYFVSIAKPIVIVIDSFDAVFKANKSEIFEFFKQLVDMGKVKIVMIARTFDINDFEKKFSYEKISIGALEKNLFEKFLKSNGIRLIGPVSDELYKHTHGYFFYIALSIKIIQIRGLSLYEFLEGFVQSFLSYNDFILREGLALVDPVSGHLFRLLTIVRHPIDINLLKTLRLYDEYKIKLFIETYILSKDENMLYLKDYYKDIAENSIPDNVALRLHKSCVELYNTQLPLKPFERNLLISRATMRAEIEYHSMFLPKKPVIKHKIELDKPEIQQIQPLEVVEQPKDIQNIRFIFESEEAENAIMSQIVDSINEFVTLTDEQVKEIERENNMSLVELMNLARQEENKFNFKRVIMIYQRALMMKNTPDFQTFLPIINSRLASAYAKISDWFNALKFYEESAKIYSVAGDNIKLAEIMLEIANIRYVMFKKDKAREILEKLLALKNLPKDLYVKAFILLADISEGSIDLVYGYLKSAFEFAETSEDEALMAELYYKLAIASDDIGETKQAVLLYKHCVEIERKNNVYIASAYSNLATIYEDSGVIESALQFYKKSLEIDEADKNYNQIYSSSMKLATLNRKLSSDVAITYYEKAYEVASKINEPFYKVASLMSMGDFFFMKKNFEKAFGMYYKAKNIASGNLSENNIKKIEQRINDLTTKLGDVKVKELTNGAKDVK